MGYYSFFLAAAAFEARFFGAAFSAGFALSWALPSLTPFSNSPFACPSDFANLGIDDAPNNTKMTNAITISSVVPNIMAPWSFDFSYYSLVIVVGGRGGRGQTLMCAEVPY